VHVQSSADGLPEALLRQYHAEHFLDIIVHDVNDGDVYLVHPDQEVVLRDCKRLRDMEARGFVLREEAASR
jgi:uncharacterized protein HemX